MSRLIDADALEKYVERDFVGVTVYDVTPSEAVADIIDMIDAQPTIDAEPVKHGEWSKDENEVWYCLECDTWLYVDSGTADMNYCPHCGAKMDGGNDG